MMVERITYEASDQKRYRFSLKHVVWITINDVCPPFLVQMLMRRYDREMKIVHTFNTVISSLVSILVEGWSLLSHMRNCNGIL